MIILHRSLVIALLSSAGVSCAQEAPRRHRTEEIYSSTHRSSAVDEGIGLQAAKDEHHYVDGTKVYDRSLVGSLPTTDDEVDEPFDDEDTTDDDLSPEDALAAMKEINAETVAIMEDKLNAIATGGDANCDVKDRPERAPAAYEKFTTLGGDGTVYSVPCINEDGKMTALCTSGDYCSPYGVVLQAPEPELVDVPISEDGPVKFEGAGRLDCPGFRGNGISDCKNRCVSSSGCAFQYQKSGTYEYVKNAGVETYTCTGFTWVATNSGCEIDCFQTNCEWEAASGAGKAGVVFGALVVLVAGILV